MKEEFIQNSVYDQLGKIIDSAGATDGAIFGRYNQLTEVITDDFDSIEVSKEEAIFIRKLCLSYEAPKRLKFLKFIQTTKGLMNVKECYRLRNL